MNVYTTIFFDWNLYQPNKSSIKDLRTKFNIQSNEKKVKENVPYNEILGIYKVFKSENRIINDKNLRNRKGATGIWSGERDTLKIVAFDPVDEKESPPILAIYRGMEETFYKELLKVCIGIGCEIGKLEEDDKSEIKVIFKKQLSLEDIERRKNLDEVKIELEKEFNIRTNELKNIGYELSDIFFQEWESCINTYGYYDIRKLLNDTKGEVTNNGK